MLTMMANLTNRIDPFDKMEDIKKYFDWLEMFLMVQGISRDTKVAHIISDNGSKAYAEGCSIPSTILCIVPSHDYYTVINMATVCH